MTTTEWHPLLLNTRFLSELVSIDLEASKEARKSGCPHCGGTLHSGFYERKIRIGECGGCVKDFDVCFSLCCSAEGCRKRTRPPSVRFCGRSPYPLAVIALAEIFAKGPSKKRVAAICELLTVTERTIRRWLQIWRAIAKTSWWRKRLGLGLPEWHGSSLMRLVLFFTSGEKDQTLTLGVILRELSSFKFTFSRCLTLE